MDVYFNHGTPRAWIKPLDANLIFPHVIIYTHSLCPHIFTHCQEYFIRSRSEKDASGNTSSAFMHRDAICAGCLSIPPRGTVCTQCPTESQQHGNQPCCLFHSEEGHITAHYECTADIPFTAGWSHTEISRGQQKLGNKKKKQKKKKTRRIA